MDDSGTWAKSSGSNVRLRGEVSFSREAIYRGHRTGIQRKQMATFNGICVGCVCTHYKLYKLTLHVH